MRRYSFRQFVSLITLLPLIILAIWMESFFLHDRFAEMDRDLIERGKFAARQLASGSEYGVLSNNLEFMRNSASATLRQQDMRGLAILDAESHNLVEAGEFSETAKITLANLKSPPPLRERQAGRPFAGSDLAMQTEATINPVNRFAFIHEDTENLLISHDIVPEEILLNVLEPTPAAKPLGRVILEISKARTEVLKSRLLWSTIAATAIFLALILYLVHLSSRYIIYPVSLLSDAVQKIGRGNLGERVAESSLIAELDILGHGINEMAARLQHESTNLQSLVEERTAQATQAQLAAEAAQREAEHANKAKSRFLAAASHDLRQPIHAQGLFLDVLSRTELTSHQRELLSSARAASEASGEMLNALLDFSRIEAGVIKQQIKPFLLQPLFNKIENEFARQADAKDLVFRLRETSLAVRSDPILLELILRNLVSNAITYTENGGVLIACRRRGNLAVLEVWDTGIGIEPEHQQEVFREFHQLGNPERDSRKGLGLGLAICDGLARTLGHKLTLVSIPRRGSVFRLALPIASMPLPDRPDAAKNGATRALDVRILVIDDDETVRAAMLHLLRNWGGECEAAESIEEALAIARASPPGVVISDYRLREQRTGAEAISALREYLGNNLPALLITGDTAPERLREAQASGIPLLHKPLSPSQLYHSLLEVLEGSTKQSSKDLQPD